MFQVCTVAVWGGIIIEGRTNFVLVKQTLNAETYADYILRVVSPFVENGGPRVLSNAGQCPSTHCEYCSKRPR